MDFFRFPHMPHLAWLGEGALRDDKVMSPVEANALLARKVVVEEKVDGANVGISSDEGRSVRVQNRGTYLTREWRPPQFRTFFEWIAAHRDALLDALSPDLLLFGEWCYAVHSARYTELPDWFLAFDVYDRARREFWSTTRRDSLRKSPSRRWSRSSNLLRRCRHSSTTSLRRYCSGTAFRSGLKARGLVTYSDLFGRLASRFGKSRSSPFDFVVVDEAQDVSVPQLRFLGAFGAGRPNGLFFAGDLGQRIFQQPFSWKALGVDIRGRSRTLRINYRTSHQIRMQADRLLAPELSDVDGNKEERRGTISVFNGPKPELRVLDTPAAELEAVGRWLADRTREGSPPPRDRCFRPFFGRTG